MLTTQWIFFIFSYNRNKTGLLNLVSQIYTSLKKMKIPL